MKEVKYRRPLHPLARCRPLGDRVVVKRDLPRKESTGGILLPESAQLARMPTGTVVAVGPGKLNDRGERVPVALEVGMRVILASFAGLEVRDPGMRRTEEDEYVLLREEDVVAVLPEEEAD